jgi:hypothetical protein
MLPSASGGCRRVYCRQYGEASLVQFLNALGRAHSLEEAIATALPISFGEFNRQWLRWIGSE